jgi:signal transduction histidine kinase
VVTLQQQASLFTLFGVVLVAGLGLLTYRQRPEPIYRSWVLSYLWGIPTALASVIVAFVGINWTALVMMTGFGSFTTWWMLRMADQLEGRPFRRRGTTALVVGMIVLAQVLWFSGLPMKAAMGPPALALVAAHFRLGVVALRAGKQECWRGLEWLGIALIVHACWICTYPFVVDTPFHWLGHLVDACLEIGVGAGMVTFIMIRTMRQLAEADRLKHEFLAAASHELRTPLTSVLGYAEFLEDGLGGKLTPEQDEYVAQIKRGGQRLRRIVDEMLDLARVQAGTFQLAPAPAELGAVVREEALALLPQARASGVDLVAVVPEEPLAALVDAPRVGQVVQNLVANAIKFTPAGGRVRVSLRRDPAGCRVEVEDTGIGIDPAHVPKLFQQFYQVETGTRRSHGGAGLGLTIAKALVEAHGGAIGVDSRPSQGSTFWFTLPVTFRPGPSAAPAPGPGTAVGSPPSAAAG